MSIELKIALNQAAREQGFILQNIPLPVIESALHAVDNQRDNPRKIIARLTETVQANALEIADLRAKLAFARDDSVKRGEVIRSHEALIAQLSVEGEESSEIIRNCVDADNRLRAEIAELRIKLESRSFKPFDDDDAHALDIIKRAAAKIEAGG